MIEIDEAEPKGKLTQVAAKIVASVFTRLVRILILSAILHACNIVLPVADVSYVQILASIIAVEAIVDFLRTILEGH